MAKNKNPIYEMTSKEQNQFLHSHPPLLTVPYFYGILLFYQYGGGMAAAKPLPGQISILMLIALIAKAHLRII
ncbi:hypothetical protein LJC48_03280 [Desulfovibrio sp. OttesenSCG-928-C06]|nr:hypothetical protein [Desulfovibrio sp. OttesenSCG-928-C06]